MKNNCNLKQMLYCPVAAIGLLLIGGATTAGAANLVQDFYLPMPESQIYQANNAIISGTGSTIASTFSIVVTGNGTVIYYDQWEDGYETDISNPTQPTTQVWGDGNDANGIPPGFAHDPLGLPAGTVITLTNNVPLPRNPSQILWDARDHIAANKALVISRAGWPVPTGPVFAGAVGVLSTMDYGTNYISPVGQDLANNLFKYVGLFVMAAQNNTAVTIDPNGNGIGMTNIVLNQGESYLVNGGVKKGGRITATKPVQADLVIGHVGASFASDWFTLYPVEEWDNTYYTPVGSATKVAQPAYVYLFNPNTNAIVVNYRTQSGSGSVTVPGTNGVYQFQMPAASGASFISASGQNFFALCTVAANNSSDTAFNWGFTLVPKAALTTEADVGWGPGSADGTVDGSPVWVTTLANTRIYVDYKGDHAGLLTDPNGNHYDTNYDVVTLQSKKIFDPSKNQTGMRVYTVDGTLLTADWGEDPDTAQPGNPYIDAGTTVIPFPVPVLKKSAVIVTDVPPAGLSIGDTIQYTVEVDNKGLLPLGNTVVLDAPSTNLTYVTNSTTLNGTPIPDSVTGTPYPLDAPGYTIPVILSRGTSTFQYLYVVNAGGIVSNSVNIGGTTITSMANLTPPPTNGASVSLDFTDTNGVPVSAYLAGANVFVTMTNAVGNTSPNSVQAITVTVQDVTDGDVENILLTETSTNTGVFRNIGGLATSTTAGLGQQDGTLNVTPGDTLSVAYTDPTFGDSASNTATILMSALNKQLYLSTAGTNGAQNLDRIDPVAYMHGPMQSSVDLSGGTVATIGVDGEASAATNGSSLTMSYPMGGGANGLMLVSVGTDGTRTVSSVTYNGVALTSVASVADAGSTKPRVEVFRLLNPPSGAHNLVVTPASSGNLTVGVSTFTNVNQSTPLGTAATSSDTSSATVSSAAGQLVFGTICAAQSEADSAGQSQQWSTNAAATIYSIGSTKAGAASVTVSWTPAGGGNKAAVVVVPIQPSVSLIGGQFSTSFSQTPAFCSPFTIASNSVITITNYLTVTNGVMPTNPAITATLQFNGVSFLTLTNPVFTAAAGITNLVWSGTLASNLTVPAGQYLTYIITNNQSGVAFHINYDSTNAPSKISLPATTVINVNTLGIYDAPYPGGNLVSSPVAGSTLYVRANVSDPFGAYDITSLGVAITGPVPAANLNTNLTGANVVANDGCSKTYEFAWQTGSTTGDYLIVGTGNEGTEGVTASAAATVSLIFLDLGTPSTTEFTGGNNGPATNGYPADTSVCVRVTDLDQNTNSATVQTLFATVSSSTGDSEILVLTETGTNTGVFTGCIGTSTSSGTTPGDGTVYAPIGSVLTASYTDPTDPSDQSSATSVIQPPPGVPGVVINKTIVSPFGGQAGLNQPVTYNLQVINTGSTVLTNVSVSDNFPSGSLSYSSATPTPDSIGAGVLTWTSLGNLASGQSTNLTVTFITIGIGGITNSATVNGGTVTNSSAVGVFVSNPQLSITKILLSPASQPVPIGSNAVFRITIQNTGNTVIPTLPLEDNFSAAYYQFVSATIPPDGSGAGSLLWTNLAASVALATNAIITNDITMLVVGQGNPANNTAVADFAVDSFGNAVPTASGSTNVVTAAASISGYVYNDLDQSGTLTPGDTPLAGVTLQLFTDPNGDGDPSDGTVVQIVTSDAGGYYELDNLPLGHYVVVETDLPGFANTVPANGRLAFNLTSLTADTGNYFFQYQPSASLYSTFSGTVINDIDGNGTNTSQAGLASVTVDLVQDVNSNGIADGGEPVVASATTDAGGNYSFAGVTPGYYVLRETDPFGYYSSGDSQSPNDNQISIVTTNGILSTNNYFFDRLLPTAVNDTNSAYYLTPTIISPLTNDISPNGDPLTISNAVTTDGILVINPGATNLTFTPTNTGVATIIYTAADAHGGTSNAVITVNVTALADLGLSKSAIGSVPATSNLDYTITVTNAGPSGADNVTVTDAVPAGAVFVNASGGGVNDGGVVTWNLGSMTNGAAITLTLTVTVPAGGSLTNVASVGSTTSDPNPGNNTNPPVVTSISGIADVAVAKSAAANVAAAGNLIYTISVTNLGPSLASSVTVTDALPAGATFVSASGDGAFDGVEVTWSLGDLPNGAVSNVTLTVTAPASGTLTNVATAGSPTGDPNPTNNVTPPVKTAVALVADVAVGKSGPTGVTLNTGFSYAITVTNFGPSTAAGLFVTDSLPAGVVFVSSVPATTTNASNQVIWSLSDLASATTTNLTLTVISTLNGTVTNQAAGGSSSSDPDASNNTSQPVATLVTNIPPVANPDSFAITENTTNVFDPLANDVVQTPGGVLMIIGVNPTNGTAIILGGTNVQFIPNPNFTGTATIGYLITDGVGGTNGSLITVMVTNIAPLANPDNFAITENTTNVFNPLANDLVQTPGGVLSIIGVAPTNGTAIILGGTNVQFIPNLNYVGMAAIGYTITDGIGGTNSSLITVTVTNIPPVANPDAFTMGKNTTNSFNPLSNDVVQTPGGVLSIIGVAPTNGAASILGGTNVQFIPNLNFTGVATIGYTITDGIGGTNSSLITVTVTNTVTVPNADVQVYLSGPTNATVGDLLIFTLAVTNAGPMSATNTVAHDLVPTNLVFASASDGGLITNHIVTWPVFPLLASGQSTNLTVNATSVASSTTNLPTGNPLNFIQSNSVPFTGVMTNVGSAFAVTFDPNTNNNNGTLQSAQVQTLLVPGVFSVLLLTNTYPTNVVVTNTILPIGQGLFVVGASAWNPVTQLYEEFLNVTNIGATVVHALRLYVGGLRSGVTLYNATGTNNGVPYVEYDPPYDSPLNPFPAANNSVSFTLEFFSANGRPFTNSLSAVPIPAPTAQPVNGTQVTNVAIHVADNRGLNTRYLIQFGSIPGRTYTVEYKDNLADPNWTIAVPSIVASSTSTLWYDVGPPVTLTAPGAARYYLVILQP